MPGKLRVFGTILLTVIATNRYLGLYLVIWVDHESVDGGINDFLLIKLLNEEHASVVLWACVWGGSETNYAISLEAVQTMLHDDVAEHGIGTNSAILVKTDLVWGFESENGARSVVNLEYIEVAVDVEGVRETMDEWIITCTCITIRSLYPEPWATSVEDQLVGLLLGTEVYCGEDLDVEEIWQVFLQEALMTRILDTSSIVSLPLGV